MPKRKRADNAGEGSLPNGKAQRLEPDPQGDDIHVRLVTGSYERILHGIHARIPKHLLKGDASELPKPPATFADSFLFNAHASSIRALALSPPSAPGPNQKRILATGGADARINLYHLSTRAPRPSKSAPAAAAGVPHPADARVGNRSLGALHAHDAAVTALRFPSRGKLVSACAANAVGVTSTRTWSTLAVLRAPVPRQPGRPAGDTSTRASLPQGVNALAVHPSRRLMLSVGRAERCMRLWNLTTGRRAGVLSFEGRVLRAVREGPGRWSGEGRTVAWSDDGERFVIGWEAGAVVFSLKVGLRRDARFGSSLTVGRRVARRWGAQCRGQRRRFTICSLSRGACWRFRPRTGGSSSLTPMLPRRKKTRSRFPHSRSLAKFRSMVPRLGSRSSPYCLCLIKKTEPRPVYLSPRAAATAWFAFGR
jgi:hypothetical protein